MTAQEYMAEQTARMGQIIAHFVATTHPDKLNWQPQTEGSAPTRSVLEMVGECVVVNRHFAALLRGEDVQIPAGGWIGPDFANGEDAQNQVIASATLLAEVIRALDDETLNRTFQARRGPTTGKNLMIMAYRNMAYHAGQINLIQLLMGDVEWHMPPMWY